MLVVGVGLAWYFRGDDMQGALSPQTERVLAALAGRLSQMADSQAAVQAKIGEQLQAQERLVAKALDERLENFSQRVGERLNESANKSQTALTDLRERLAVIDKAQQNLAELSGQMVGLQDILANKQARGAFGEIQLRDLVEAHLRSHARDA